MALTDLSIKKLKPKDGRAYKKADSEGLYLLVKPNGSLLWRFDYKFAEKRKTLSLGAYPEVTIRMARDKRDSAKAQLADGSDPAGGAGDGAPADSFESVARRWFAGKLTSWDLATSTRAGRALERDIYPVLGRMRIRDIEPRDVLAAIRKIEDRGAIEMAKRVKNYCGEVFRMAIPEGLCDRDPTADIRGALKPSPKKKRRTAMPLGEMPEFRQRLGSYDLDPVTRDALELVVLTLVRGKEVRYASKREFEGLGTGAPLWRIPAERMKMDGRGIEHLVPLSRQAERLVTRLIDQGRTDMLLPGNSIDGVQSYNTLIFALYRLGYHSRATVHGFRGTFSTAANEAHDEEGRRLWSVDAIEVQLAHHDDDEVRSAYNAALYLPERRRLMQWWADLVWPDAPAEQPVDLFEELLG